MQDKLMKFLEAQLLKPIVLFLILVISPPLVCIVLQRLSNASANVQITLIVHLVKLVILYVADAQAP
jgi:hypothetical protein